MIQSYKDLQEMISHHSSESCKGLIQIYKEKDKHITHRLVTKESAMMRKQSQKEGGECRMKQRESTNW